MHQPNRESIDANVFTIDQWDEAEAHGPGAVIIEEEDENPGKVKALIVIVPGETSMRAIPVDGSRGWTFDGNREKPTLTPSILAKKIKHDGQWFESWHGYLTAGRFVSC